MTEYRSAREIAADTAAAYAYLSDVENLPKYFPRITAAHRTGEEKVETTAVLDGEDVGSSTPHETVRGEAWFRTDDDSRSIEWGSEGPHDYHGSLSVNDHPSGSHVEIVLNTEADYPGVQDSLEETLDSIVGALT